MVGTLFASSYSVWRSRSTLYESVEINAPIYDLPFPSITICPENKFLTDALNFTEMYHSESESQEKQFAAHVCDLHLSGALKKVRDFTTNEIVDGLKAVSNLVK